MNINPYIIPGLLHLPESPEKILEKMLKSYYIVFEIEKNENISFETFRNRFFSIEKTDVTARCRQIFFFYMLEIKKTKVSLKKLAVTTGRKDHSNVLHARKVIIDYKRLYPDFNLKLTKIIQNL